MTSSENNGYAFRENRLQTICLDYLKGLGVYAVNVHGGGWCAKGTPDILACIDGKFAAFELKVGSNEMQPDQRVRRKAILDNGGLHYCIRSLDDMKKAVKEIYEMPKL